MVLLETEERKEAPSSVKGVSIVGGSCTVSRNSNPSPSEVSGGVGFVKLVAMISWVSLARLHKEPITRQMGHAATAALKQLGTSTNFEVLIPTRLQFLTDSAFFFFDKFFFPKKKFFLFSVAQATGQKQPGDISFVEQFEFLMCTVPGTHIRRTVVPATVWESGATQ
jgi:hypothetical protein